MARARTLTTLQNEVRALTDTEEDTHNVDADLLRWINQGIAELWRKLVAVSPDRYAIAGTPFATTVGTDSYVLPDDFLSIYRVVRMDGALRRQLEPFNLMQAALDNPVASNRGLARYRIIGGGIDGDGTRIVFDPDPGANTYAYWYVQAPQLLAAPTDTFDGIAGYEDWVVLFAALRVFIRNQDPEQVSIQQEMARIESGITASAAKRDVGSAATIADVRPRRRRW